MVRFEIPKLSPEEGRSEQVLKGRDITIRMRKRPKDVNSINSYNIASQKKEKCLSYIYYVYFLSIYLIYL